MAASKHSLDVFTCVSVQIAMNVLVKEVSFVCFLYRHTLQPASTGWRRLVILQRLQNHIQFWGVKG